MSLKRPVRLAILTRLATLEEELETAHRGLTEALAEGSVGKGDVVVRRQQGHVGGEGL